jgi:hypothetical protein
VRCQERSDRRRALCTAHDTHSALMVQGKGEIPPLSDSNTSPFPCGGRCSRSFPHHDPSPSRGQCQLECGALVLGSLRPRRPPSSESDPGSRPAGDRAQTGRAPGGAGPGPGSSHSSAVTDSELSGPGAPRPPLVPHWHAPSPLPRLGPGNPRPPGPPPSGPRFPVPDSRPNRETGIPCFPIPAESGIGDSPFPDLAESGIAGGFPPRFPAKIAAKSGIHRGNGNWGFK